MPLGQDKTTKYRGGNADTVDGAHASTTSTAGYIPVAGSDGKISVDWLDLSGIESTTTTITESSGVTPSRSINTTPPLTGGGDLSEDRTIALSGISSMGSGNQIIALVSDASTLAFKTVTAGANVTVTHTDTTVTIAATDTDTTDHGALTGLSDDDHTQYHNDTRGDARYAPIAKGVTNGDSHDHSGGDGAQVDHGGLAGLTDDDHTQYLLRQPTANQVINESGGDYDLRIEGDTDSYLFFLNAGTGRIGIGQSNPSYKLDVAGDIRCGGGNYYSSDGSQGFSGTQIVNPGPSQKTMTVKNGIITDIS